MTSTFEYNFPAIRGIQAGREYYVAMCPLKLIPKIFLFDEEESSLSPEVRAQRILNKGRIPALTDYVIENKEDYVFSAITASIDGKVKFEPIENNKQKFSTNGQLRINMNARFIINDGQHRRAAIEQAIKVEPDLGYESIAVVFFIDRGLERSQQMFSDLNRHAVKPSRSLGLLYEHRNDMAKVSKLIAIQSKAFQGLVEMERSTLSERSRKLFTLSAIYTGCQALLEPLKFENYNNAYNTCNEYWSEVAEQFDDWKQVQNSKISSGEVRKDKIHAHALSLQCFGIVGSQLLREKKKDWKKVITKFKSINWNRSNAGVWEGRALIGGRISKTSSSVTLTTNYLKKMLGLKLNQTEQDIEKSFLKGK